MDSLIGLATPNFAILIAETSVSWNIIRLHDHDDKIVVFDDNKLVAVDGEPAERNNFVSYIKCNSDLTKFRNRGIKMTTHATANYIANELGKALRKNPVQVNSLIAGIDNNKDAELYWVDYLGTLVKTNVAAHGYCASFVLGLLDKKYRVDLTRDEALDILRDAVAELRTRLVLTQKKFIAKIITREAVDVVEL